MSGKKLGLMLSVPPGKPNFEHGLRLAEAALSENVVVYFYCIDDGVEAIRDERIQRLRQRGLKLHVCAYGAERRGIPMSDLAIFSGLTVVSDLIASTDRFVSFN